jgi:hypothetical protein
VGQLHFGGTRNVIPVSRIRRVLDQQLSDAVPEAAPAPCSIHRRYSRHNAASAVGPDRGGILGPRFEVISAYAADNSKRATGSRVLKQLPLEPGAACATEMCGLASGPAEFRNNPHERIVAYTLKYLVGGHWDQ